MFFGKELKKARLDVKIGLHKFAKKSGLDIGILSSVEHGWEKPPEDKEWLESVFKALEANEDTKKRLEEFIKMPFIMQEMNENVMIGHATKTDGSIATSEDLVNVSNYINEVAKKHNKKADEYNKNLKEKE